MTQGRRAGLDAPGRAHSEDQRGNRQGPSRWSPSDYWLCVHSVSAVAWWLRAAGKQRCQPMTIGRAEWPRAAGVVSSIRASWQLRPSRRAVRDINPGALACCSCRMGWCPQSRFAGYNLRFPGHLQGTLGGAQPVDAPGPPDLSPTTSDLRRSWRRCILRSGGCRPHFPT